MLCMKRFVRLCADASFSLVSVSCLSELDVLDTRRGLLKSLTLFGSVLVTITLSLIADSLGTMH